MRPRFDILEERTVLSADFVNFVMPYDATVYMTFESGSAGAVTDFGIGTNQSDAHYLLFNMPNKPNQTTGEVSAGDFHAGEVVPFAMRTFWVGQNWYAFSGTNDGRGREVYLDRTAGGVAAIEQTSPTTWLLHMDDAGSVDDDDNDVVIQLRIERINHAPTTTGIPDQSVDEDGSISLALGNFFADDGDLSYSVVADSNPALFSSVEIVDGRLNLGLFPNAYGESQLTIRATDAAGLFVEDTFALTVRPINDPPVSMGIPDIAVDEDARPYLLDLHSLFSDPDDSTLSFSVQSDDNAALAAATINDGNLKLDFVANAFGASTITVRATDSAGSFADSSFVLNVRAVNDPPVALGFPNIDVQAASKPVVIDLNGKFADVDDTQLRFSAVSDNGKLCSVAVSDGTLTLDFAKHAGGIANVVVRATDAAGALVESRFSVSVEARHDRHQERDDDHGNERERREKEIAACIIPINASLATQSGYAAPYLKSPAEIGVDRDSRSVMPNSDRSNASQSIGWRTCYDDRPTGQSCRPFRVSPAASNAEKKGEAVRDAAIKTLENNQHHDTLDVIAKDIAQRSATTISEKPSAEKPEPKGNNGVGNGQDPAPPGQPKENDGAGTAPGNPAIKGGKKD